MSETQDIQGFENLLEYLKTARGFDFTAYKRASLRRRVLKRMQVVNIEDFTSYIDYLEVRPEEFTLLFNTILINVTSFYRDEEAWQQIASDVVPRILNGKSPGHGVRIWSAGCASGQESYTIAMVLAEAMGMEQVRNRVKIYATDADDEALSHARFAAYDQREVESLPSELLEKYFDKTGDRYTFHKDLRRSVIFGRHDLIQDAPISRVDLLVCRNTLMYFNSEIQTRMLARFHFALNDPGFLFLGRSETLLTHSNTFFPVDIRRRIFAKVPRGSTRSRMLLMNQMSDGLNEPPVDQNRLRDTAADVAPVAQILVDSQLNLVMSNQQARNLFGLTSRDLGCPLRDLEISYRPVELRSMIEQSLATMRTISVKEVAWPSHTIDTRFLDVDVVPLCEVDGTHLGVTVSFTDATRYRRLQDELERSNQELETTLEELQSANEELETTNEELQSTVEELETTNEELQSTVEELETTNEELQSTNEELETMNEELQSTNEELQTINDEARLRSEEVTHLNSFLESILSSVRSGVVVADCELRVLVWNLHAEKMWGMRGDEAMGKHLFNLDIGLPVEELKGPVRRCLSGDGEPGEVVVSATNRRGKGITCKVLIAPLIEPHPHNTQGVRGVLFLMEEVAGSYETLEEAAQREVRGVADGAPPEAFARGKRSKR